MNILLVLLLEGLVFTAFLSFGKFRKHMRLLIFAKYPTGIVFGVVETGLFVGQFNSKLNFVLAIISLLDVSLDFVENFCENIDESVIHFLVSGLGCY